MLPLQPKDELVFGTPTTSDDPSLMEGNIISFSSSSSNGKKLDETSNPRLGKRQTKSRDEGDIRKVIMHRDIERRRRQEMSNLFVDLRSSLPLEHRKGKRSISDDIETAVDYIKQMQKSNEELRIRRGKLKNVSNVSDTIPESSNSSDSLPNTVVVNHTLDGAEILISHSVKNSQFGISWILAELEEREVDVVSCVSTPINGGFLHKIQIQASDMTSVLDVTELQDRLTKCLQVNG